MNFFFLDSWPLVCRREIMKAKKWIPVLILAMAWIASAVHLPPYLYRQSGRDAPLKIRPKPCINTKGLKGQCMFVWECIKGKGQHLGRCVDGFLFGTCCGQNTKEDFLAEPGGLSLEDNAIGVSGHNSTPATLPTVSPNVTDFKTTTAMMGHESPFGVETTLVTPPSVTEPTVAPLSEMSHFESIAQEEESHSNMVAVVDKIEAFADKLEHLSDFDIPNRFHTTTTSKPVQTTTTATTTTTSTTTAPSTTVTTTTTTPSTTVSTTTTAPPMTQSSTTPPPTTTTAPSTTTLQLPDKVPSNVFAECGLPSMLPQMRIVGGEDSKFGSWPWQVSVRRSTFFGFSSTHRCGGAILNENWVATAGHCVADLLLAQIRIRVGEYDLSSVGEKYPFVERGVLRRHVHPNYNADTYEYDLALVRLDKSLESAPNIQPICLPKKDDLLVGETATITGWGRLKEGGTLPSVLQQVEVPIVSNSKCEQMFLAAGRKENIPNFFICAGYENGGRDSCQGDSGGPLQIKGSDGHWYLAGIISWGIGCGEPNLPGVCTRISKFKEWILKTIEKDSG